jgi:hypothetical protein
VKRISENQNNIYNIELNNGMIPGYTLTRNSNIKVTADENKINSHQKTVTPGSNKKSPISGGHDLKALDDFFMSELDIQNEKVVNIPKFKIKNVKDLGNGIYEVDYLKLAEDRGSTEIRYRENLRPKTVLDPEIHNIEILTKKVLNKVQDVITQDDVDRALTSRNAVPLDISIDGMKIRTYIRANPKTGEINIENYHLDTTR